MSETKKAWDAVTSMLSGHTLAMGPVSTDRYVLDPKRLCFFLARYKFAAKMLKRATQIIDVGCGDGMGTLTFVADTRADVLGVDFDAAQIEHASKTLVPALESMNTQAKGRLRFEQADFVRWSTPAGSFDGLVSLDVIEHIDQAEENAFLVACRDALVEKGVAVFGTPNDHASAYASAHSQAGHINLFTPDRFQTTLESYFSRVFLFSMNDEMVHTGFDKMAHYLMALAVK